MLRIVWVYSIFKLYPDNFYVLMIIYPISWVATGAAMLISYFVISRREFKGKQSQPPDKSDGGREEVTDIDAAFEDKEINDGAQPLEA